MHCGTVEEHDRRSPKCHRCIPGMGQHRNRNWALRTPQLPSNDHTNFPCSFWAFWTGQPIFCPCNTEQADPFVYHLASAAKSTLQLWFLHQDIVDQWQSNDPSSIHICFHSQHSTDYAKLLPSSCVANWWSFARVVCLDLRLPLAEQTKQIYLILIPQKSANMQPNSSRQRKVANDCIDKSMRHKATMEDANSQDAEIFLNIVAFSLFCMHELIANIVGKPTQQG